MSMDVSKAIAPKSDQLNSDDLITGPRTIRIRDVKVAAGQEQPIWVYFDGDDNKPWKPCKTAARTLASVWGADASKWIGLSLTLYNDPEVTWGGMKVGGCRVSHMEGLTQPRTLMLTKTRGKKGATVIKPLEVKAPTKASPVPDVEPDPSPVPDAPTNPLFQDARDNAELGTAAMRAWWQTKTKAEQKQLGEILAELQEIAAKADKETE